MKAGDNHSECTGKSQEGPNPVCAPEQVKYYNAFPAA